MDMLARSRLPGPVETCARFDTSQKPCAPQLGVAASSSFAGTLCEMCAGCDLAGRQAPRSQGPRAVRRPSWTPVTTMVRCVGG